MLLNIPVFTDLDYDFQHNLLHWWEIILTPICFFFFVSIGKWYCKRKSIEGIDRKLFIRGLMVKMLGGIFITLIYNFYYAGGDTTAYFNDGRLINKIFWGSPVTAIRILWNSGGDFYSWPDDLQAVIEHFRMSFAANSWMVSKISSIFSLFWFQSMLCTTLCFAFFAHLCTWKFYSTVSRMYPHLKNKLVYAIVFVPSLNIWGSGILKDTITISATFLIFCSVYEIFFKREKIFRNILIMIVSAYLLGVIKSYILISFGLSLYIWLIISLSLLFKNKFIRISFLLFVLSVAALSSLLIIDYIGKQFAALSIENVLSTSVSTGKFLQYASLKEEGSVYDIGEIEPSIQGFIAIAPAAINVTLFRPYLWESHKLIIFFAAVESSIIFLYFLFLLLKNKVIFFFTKILSDPFLILCFVFTLIIAAFVGISSLNFGTLVRYKIPCIPFFLSALVIIDSLSKKKKALKPSLIAE